MQGDVCQICRLRSLQIEVFSCRMRVTTPMDEINSNQIPMDVNLDIDSGENLKPSLGSHQFSKKKTC